MESWARFTSRIRRSSLSIVQLSCICSASCLLGACFSSITASLLVILGAPAFVYRASTKSPSQPKALTWPIVNTFGILLIVQLLCVVLRDDTPNGTESSLAIADGHLSLVGSVCAGTLTYIMQSYSIQLSTLVNAYLITSAFSGILKEMSYIKRPELRASGLLSPAVVLLELAIFILVQLSNGGLHDLQHRGQRGTAIKGFWDKSNFLWLNLTLVFHFINVKRVNDLIDPGPSFNSELLYRRFIPHWEKGKKAVNRAFVNLFNF